jgi:hypothetical protein
MSSSRSVRSTTVAMLWFVLLAVAVTGPALFLDRSLGPESQLDSDPLFTVGNPPPKATISDATRTDYDLPRDFAAADGFRAGRLDLWNPRVGLGVPLWAEGGAPFSPLKVPFYLMPSRRTYDLGTALRLVVAGLGAYLLARRRGLAAVPALAAGSLFELSGAMVETLPFGSAGPPCLLPWALLGAEAIARERTPAAAAGSGIALGVATNTGHPMLALGVFAGFGVAIAGHILAAWRRPRTIPAIVALACLAVALGVAIGAPALLPGWEAWRVGRLYKSTPKWGLMTALALDLSRSSLPIALVSPGLLAPLQAEFPTAFPVALSPAVGVMGLLLALVGFLGAGLDVPLVLVLLLGIGMTLAPPGLGWVNRVPPLHFVYSTYCWALVALPLTQAAGGGVAVLTTPRARRVVVIALGLVVVGVLWLLPHLYFVPGVGFFDQPIHNALVKMLGRPTGWLRLVLPLVVATTVAVWIAVAGRAGLSRRGAALVVTLACVELIVSLAPTVWWRDSKVLGSPPSPAVRFLRERLDNRYRMIAVPKWVMGFPNTPALFGLRDLRGNGALPVERYVQYLQGIAPSVDWFYLQTAGDVVRHPLLDLAGVRYVVGVWPGPPPLLEDDPAMPRVYRDERVAIYENTAALPRARIVHAAVPVRDAGEAFARLTEAAKAGSHAAAAGLVDRIVVEPSADGHPPPEAPAVTAPASEDVQLVDGSDPDRVELVAPLASPGWVVLADTFYPGWSATIDGVATPIHPADLLFRAVFVPAGTHRILFRYEAPALRLGLVLAVVGLGLSAFLIVRRGAGRAPSPP